jgi:transcriptional regulator with XRE-family HTH domain
VASSGDLGGECGTMVAMPRPPAAEFPENSWRRLGDMVRDRRKALGLTQRDISEHGGPSAKTVRDVEGGRVRGLSLQSRRTLEQVLGWEPGSIGEALAGGEPRTAEPGGGKPDHPVEAATVAEQFAERVVKLKQALANHGDNITGPARDVLQREVEASSREAQNAIIRVLPWLSNEDRDAMIDILIGLRDP